MVKALMIQGTGSNVGKSLLVAGLARAFTNRGLRVRPFKPQNMSNNAAVTEDGGEIGRAQALQARAARTPTTVHMNPVLLKPETETGSQIIVQGQRIGHDAGRAYWTRAKGLMPKVLDSFRRLAEDADLILIEGAGSPAETNLRGHDIANMGFAEAARVPVLLVGDINKGGVIAQIAGTKVVLSMEDAARIKGFLVNRFRGDVRLFDEGLIDIERHTGWPGLGVVPWFNDAHFLPAEDILDLRSWTGGACKVVVPKLPRISNFDDLDPLAAEPDVTVDIIPPGHALPGDADLIVLPGSKSTISDLTFFRDQGWDIDLTAHIRRGGHVMGLCGGYQMLGTSIADPDGIEGRAQTVPGLGHLNVQTVLSPKKQLALTSAVVVESGLPVTGYEIHLGKTDGPDCAQAWLDIDGMPHGARNASGRVRGAYLHGLFGSDPFRAAFLGTLGHQSHVAYDATVDSTLDALAEHLQQHLNLDDIFALAEEI